MRNAWHKESSRHMTEPQSSRTANDVLSDSAPDVWRDEVHARISRYKTRRGRRVEGAFSMRFPFPVEEPVAPAAAQSPSAAEQEFAPSLQDRVVVEAPAGSAVNIESPEPEIVATTIPLAGVEPEAESAANASERHEPEPVPVPRIDLAPRPRPKRKVIAFPRHLSSAPVMVYRLADPAGAEPPRILDVPEELEAMPTTPFLDGLRLDPIPASSRTDEREHVDLPSPGAGVARRVCAGTVDLVVVGSASAMFAAVVYRMVPGLAFSKPLIIAAAAIPGLLWSVYQYMLLVHGGRTMGMMASGVRLRTFGGKPASLRQRRRRILSQYLSVLPLGMGLVWALVDIDQLCWHDRISQTYLTRKS